MAKFNNEFIDLAMSKEQFKQILKCYPAMRDSKAIEDACDFLRNVFDAECIALHKSEPQATVTLQRYYQASYEIMSITTDLIEACDEVMDE